MNFRLATAWNFDYNEETWKDSAHVLAAAKKSQKGLPGGRDAAYGAEIFCKGR